MISGLQQGVKSCIALKKLQKIVHSLTFAAAAERKDARQRNTWQQQGQVN